MHKKDGGLGWCGDSDPRPTVTCPGLPQDVADFEWVMWFTSFRDVILFALSGHVLFAKLCTMVAPQVSMT